MTERGWDWVKHVELLNDDRNRLPYWYPKVVGLVPTPRTVWLNVSFEDPYEVEKPPAELARKVKALVREAGLEYPVFLRTDTNSGKHDYKYTCYVESEEEVESHLAALLLDTYAKDLWPKAIVVREFVELDWRFRAFSGELPIAPEARVMILDGKVERWFFYWPEDAISLPSTPNWRKKLREMKEIAEEESETFLKMAEKVAAAFDDYWSVDFARTRGGEWILIDMALGEVSWTPEKCSPAGTSANTSSRAQTGGRDDERA
jgi:hypothetical protein